MEFAFTDKLNLINSTLRVRGTVDKDLIVYMWKFVEATDTIQRRFVWIHTDHTCMVVVAKMW